MIQNLVIFGASGDLTSRFLLPALARLGELGELAPGFSLTASALTEWDDVGFREHALGELRTNAPDVDSTVIDDLLGRLRYLRADVTDTSSVAAVIERAQEGARSGQRALAVYLALPVQLLPAAFSALGPVELPAGSRIVVEKPFGENLEEAVLLNALLGEATAGGVVDAFRVDHVLGMETLWNVVALRFSNRVLRSVWNSANIEKIEILWEETLALEGRAGYFDRAGALKDVMQNHMMHILTLVAMEQPASAEGLDALQLDVLRAIRPLSVEDAAARSRRGRYTAGRLADDQDGGGRTVSSYADEEGVDPERSTETFAEVVVDIDTPRWAGTGFVLRAGKALSARRKGVLVHFRDVDEAGLLQVSGGGGKLWLGVDGPNDIRVEITGMTSPLEPREPITLTSPPLPSRLPPYAHVLRDVLGGGRTFAVSGDQAEEAWRALTPVLEAWRDGLVPLAEYPAGSPGP